MLTKKQQEFIDKREDIEKMIANHSSICEISRFCHLKYETCVKYLNMFGINYEKNQARKGVKHLESCKDVSYYLNDKVRIPAAHLRKKLIESGIKENKCECCGLSEWQNKPIPLELHHIDRNHFNNHIENLQILCSNCHMQIHDYSNFK